MVDVKEKAGNRKYTPVIIDFGFVNRKVGTAGTPGYLAPEVFSNISSNNTQPSRAMMDIFALGSILYEVRYKRRLRYPDRCPREFKAQIDEVRLANDPLSRLIAGLVEDLPYRLSIVKALAHSWFNPSENDKAAAVLFHQPLYSGIDRDGDERNENMSEYDEIIVSEPKKDKI